MKITVLISANSEWRAIKAHFPGARLEASPYGEFFCAEAGAWLAADDAPQVTFFHGGWGKISAAATAQYVLHRFQPDLLVNLGTCGGFEGRIETGTIILVEKTLVYDIIEQMGDQTAALAHYTTDLDLSWLPAPFPASVQRGLLVSGDRDIVVEDIPVLVEHFGATAADWESASIAWVAERNNIRCLILRGVSDLVGSQGGEAYGNLGLYQERTNEIMQRLMGLLRNWLPALSYMPS